MGQAPHVPGRRRTGCRPELRWQQLRRGRPEPAGSDPDQPSASPSPPPPSSHRVLAGITEKLTAAYAGLSPAGTVRRYLTESHSLLAATDALTTITTRPPQLTRQITADRLRALAQAAGAVMTEVPEVMFVCVHNAGRSQMAAALLEHHAAGAVHVRSAGSTPADQVNPAVVQVMAELGLDLSREFPKPLTDEFVAAADVVITMGCGDACPVYPGKRYLDWELPDPAGQDLDAVRAIRDDINHKVRDLLAQIAPAAATS